MISIQYSAGLNSMPSNSTTSPSIKAMFPRCKSPWHSRIKPFCLRCLKTDASALCCCSHHNTSCCKTSGIFNTDKMQDLAEIFPNWQYHQTRPALPNSLSAAALSILPWTVWQLSSPFVCSWLPLYDIMQLSMEESGFSWPAHPRYGLYSRTAS